MTEVSTSTPRLLSGKPLSGRIAVVTGASSGLGEATSARSSPRYPRTST
jgi:hypothetical protein